MVMYVTLIFSQVVFTFIYFKNRGYEKSTVLRKRTHLAEDGETVEEITISPKKLFSPGEGFKVTPPSTPSVSDISW